MATTQDWSRKGSFDYFPDDGDHYHYYFGGYLHLEPPACSLLLRHRLEALISIRR